MGKTLNEQIIRIKSLFTEERLYGNLVNEDNGGNKLPGPNYYEIQKFLEEKTGFDTGAPGFGNKTAEALGIYLFGKDNQIKTVEELSGILTNLGFDTNGEAFGVDYATAVSEIIKVMETKLGDVVNLISGNKEMILSILNNVISSQLPYESNINLTEVLPKSPKPPIENGALKKHYLSFRKKDIVYSIDNINLKNYDVEKDLITGDMSGNIYTLADGGLLDFDYYAEITLKVEIIDDRYIDTQIESANINTGYEYIDKVVDIGYQLKNNDLRVVFAANLNPFWPGYTKWGPYTFPTPIEEEIKKIKIPQIDIKTVEDELKDSIIKKL